MDTYTSVYTGWHALPTPRECKGLVVDVLGNGAVIVTREFLKRFGVTSYKPFPPWYMVSIDDIPPEAMGLVVRCMEPPRRVAERAQGSLFRREMVIVGGRPRRRSTVRARMVLVR